MGDEFRCVDLFCGAGGFSLGFQSAGFDVVASVDRNEAALETYSHNFDNVATFETDIRNFTLNMFEEHSGYDARDIDVVIGGPPCKGFSTAGRMDPNDPRNELVVEYAKTVAELDPEVVVLENVTGFLNMHGGQYHEELRETLSEIGYTVQQPEVLTAADYGVPQLRERVIIVATRGGRVEVASPTHRPREGQEPLRGGEDLDPYVTVEDAVGDLSFLRYGQEATQYKLRPLTDYQREMRDGADELYNHKAPNHGKTVRERYDQFDYGQEMSELDEQYQTKKHSMKRWHPEEPAPTVTTLPEDFVHYDRLRIPTVREVARIQSFPDWFEFKGPRTTGGQRRRNSVPQYTQVGNAVPPKFAEAIADRVADHLTAQRIIPGT
ncbi:DNA cytosine methyltransferase [Natronobiforma cellulositropha]|uniref:DNA cytosine methyltransferase n=1 Tax=Natronobiforma cellulositropha TaxID=1679076 RepID=UPI0021D611DA|nr:DNA cytosine methyltransferase [Natronobiforma cellulositropha]